MELCIQTESKIHSIKKNKSIKMHNTKKINLRKSTIIIPVQYPNIFVPDKYSMCFILNIFSFKG